MKIYLYKNVSQVGDHLLIDYLKACNKCTISNREQSAGDNFIYLEDMKKGKNGWYQLDFTLRRMTYGPGLSKEGESTTDFALEANDGFGEQTAVVYAPRKELVAVQYNHYGPRTKVIAQYLAKFLPQKAKAGSTFHWVPILNKDTEAKLARSAIQKRLEMTVHVVGLTDIGYKKNIALDSLLRMREHTNANLVSLTLSMGQGRRDSSLSVLPLVKRILSAEESVKKLKVKTISSDHREEVLDLIGGRIMAEVENKNLSRTPGLRYTFSSRTRAIEKEMRRWVKEF